MEKKNILSGLFWLIFFIYFYVLCGTLMEISALWPKLVCIAGIIFSTIQIILAIRDMKKKKVTKQMAWLPLTKPQYRRAAMASVIVIVWAVCLAPVGFLVSSIIALLTIFFVYEPYKDKKHLITSTIVAVVFSSTLYVLFRCLGVFFPDGLLI